MRKMNKKRGFTIVELVIVVTVIAILSAVMIPTFAGIIKKAKLSTDQQAARNMNMVLSTTIDIEDLEDAMTALDEAGYNALDTLVPVSKGHAFYWDNINKSVVLVNTEEDNLVVYPENYKATYNEEWANLRDDGVQHLSNIDTEDVEDLTTALMLGAKKVTLTDDLTLKSEIVVKENATTVINLNGHDLNASKQDSRPFAIEGNTSLTIDATDSEVKVGKYGLVNVKTGSTATVVMNGGTYVANSNSENGAFIKIREGATANVTLNNVTYTDDTEENFIVNQSGAETTLTINGGNYKAKAGFQATNATFTNVTIETDGLSMEIAGGNAVISNCTIKSGTLMVSNAPAASIAVSSNGTVTVENCTMTSENLDLYVYNSGGVITATGTYNKVQADAGYIEVNGVVVAGEKPQA